MMETKLLNNNIKVFAYYPEWAIYDKKYFIEQIPVNKLTHILYAFMLPNPSQDDYNLWASNWSYPAKPYTPPPVVPEGTLVSQDEYAKNINITKLKTLKLKNPNIKILISVGGWSMSFNFSKIFADPILRNNFVISSVKFIIDNGFDGIDIDWEYPGVQGIGFNRISNDDPNNFAITLDALKKEFQKQNPNKKYEITVAMGTNPKVILNYKPILPYVDYILMMTYDYAGAWGNGGHLAALYPNPKQTDIDPEWNVSSALQNTLNIGCPLEKIVLGMPMYGRGWASIVPNDPNLPLFGNSTKGPAKTYSGNAGEPGLTDWKDLVNVIGKNGLVEYYDPDAKAYFAHNKVTGETWSYDRPETIELKTQYALSAGIAGIMFWELSEDTRNDLDNNLLERAVRILNDNNGDDNSNNSNNNNNNNSNGNNIDSINLSVTINLIQNTDKGGYGTISITNNGSLMDEWKLELITHNYNIVSLPSINMTNNDNRIILFGSSFGQGKTINSQLSYIGSGDLNTTSSTPGIIVVTKVTFQDSPKLDLTVKIKSIQFWGNGGNGEISITNNGPITLTNWSFQLTTQNFTIQNFWQLSMERSNNNNIIIKPASWQPTLNSGQTVTSGFSYSGMTEYLDASSITAGVKVFIDRNNIADPDAPLNLTVSIKSTSNWGTGGNGTITITNNGRLSISNWSFQLNTLNFVIQNFWTLTMKGTGSNITVGPPYWSTTLKPSETISSGFSYSGSSSILQAKSDPNIKLILN